MDGAEFPQKDGWSKRRVVFVVFSAVFVLGAAFFLGRLSFGRIENFLGGTLALVSDTLRDVLGFGNQGKLAAEIDLNSAPTTPQDIRSQKSASVASPFGEQDGAQLPRNKNSTEGKTGNRSKDLNTSPIISRGQSQTSTPTISTSAKISAASPPPVGCKFSSAGNPTHNILLNEVAWMGSPLKTGETFSQVSNNEWLELKNTSAQNTDIAGWQILNQPEKFKIVFDVGEKINAGKFYLLERTDDDTVFGIKADKIYSGALSNSGEWLRLFDRSCVLVDEINALTSWPAGDNTTKQTLERNNDGFGWHTSVSPGGTPKSENSLPAPASTQSQTAVNPNLRYLVAVSIQGNGSGQVSSTPTGINCGLDCGEEYPSGTPLILSATPSADSLFDGWSGACSGSTLLTAGGKASCNLIVTSTLSVVATFKSTIAPAPAAAPLAPPSSPTAAAGVNHIVIAAVQIAGASTTNDFVKILNPLSAPFNLKGYRLVKRAKISTSDTSLKSWIADTFIPAGGYYLWANSSFTAISEKPDATTTGSIADDNGVAIRLGAEDTGIIIDGVAWGAAQNVFIENTPYPTNPAANQILKRKFVNGVVQDTNNNAVDFELR